MQKINRVWRVEAGVYGYVGKHYLRLYLVQDVEIYFDGKEGFIPSSHLYDTLLVLLLVLILWKTFQVTQNSPRITEIVFSSTSSLGAI